MWQASPWVANESWIPPKIIPETPNVASPDIFVAMGTTLKTSGERLHVTLLIALLAACATNLMLVCSWL
jgi:hypothetical protein